MTITYEDMESDVADAVAEPIILDNSLLLTAAEALERECAVLEGHILMDEAPDALDALRDTIQQLRAVAMAAINGPLRIGTYRFPGVVVHIQGVSEPAQKKEPAP